MIKGAIFVFTLNETELWRQYRDRLIQEADKERLVRQLQAARSRGKTPAWGPLLVSLRAVFRKMTEENAFE